MPSDPSFGTTGFFSFLWVKRNPVFNAAEQPTSIVTDNGINMLVTDNGAFAIVSGDAAPIDSIVRWD